jgi:hypothetical protein
MNLYASLPAASRSLANYALALYPLSPIIANIVWCKAARAVELDQYTNLFNAVLAMDVHEAYSTLAEALANGVTLDSRSGWALDILADSVVIKASTDLVSDTFIRTVQLVIHPEERNSEDPLQDSDILKATRWLTEITSNPKSIGRDTVSLWEDFMAGEVPDHLSSSARQSQRSSDIRDLILALHLLRSSFIYPSSCRTDLSLSLRRALAAGVFASAPELEDARDSLIDILY